MATTAGSIQKNGQIQWIYSMSGVTQSSSRISISVDAYFASVAPYSQYYTGTKSWSGTWGSGSSGQAYNLPAGARVRLVYSPSVSVVLTDSTQTVSFAVTAQHFFGATTSTLTLSVPPRYAGTPSGLTITRNSDTSHRLNWSRNSTYSAVVVQRSVNGGAWSQVARPSGNAATWTDTSTRAGNQYRYRVAGIGGSGQSGWSNTATVYTSPNTPSGVSATRDGNNIVVDVSGKPAYATGYNIRDGATQVASNVQLPWTHVNPAAAATHTYTVQAVRGSLTSGWSSASNTVQLLAAPQAPTNLAPNGAVVSSEGQTRLSWRHNPTDSSPQTAAEYRRRVKGTSSWTTGTATTASNVALTLDAGEIEWQVRTKGQHPDWSPWSAVAVFTVIDKPGVAITDPDDLWTRRTVTVKWSFDQGQGRPQSAWEASLLLGGEVIEHRTGSGAGRSVAFTTPLVDTQEYEVIVKAAAGDVWSDAGAQSFFVQVPPAAPADMDGVWSEESGAVTVAVRDGRGGGHTPVTNYFPNPRFVGDGTWVEVYRNLNPWSSPSVTTSGWSGAAGSQASTADGITRTLSGAVGNGSSAMWTGAIDVSAGALLRFTLPLRNDGAMTFEAAPGLSWRNPAGDITHVFYRGDSATVRPGEGISLSVEWEVPSEAVTATLNVRAGTSGFPAGSKVTVLDGVSLVAEPCPPLLFNGELSPQQDLRSRWLGATGSSVSVLEGERVRTASSSGCIGIKSALPDGRPAVRIIATAPTGYFGLVGTIPGSSTTGVITVYREDDSVPSASVTLRTAASANENVWLVPSSQFPPPGEPREYRAVNDIGPGGWIVLRPSTNVGGSIWYAGAGLFEGVYDGPAFSGSSGLVQIGDTWMSAAWDGAVDNSTSTLTTAPAAVRADVERSVNGGITWVPFIEGAELPILETDTEALSNGVTLYRVTTYSADDATSVVIHEVESDSPAVWLSGGDGYTHAARLPYDPEVSITRGRERAVRRYAGRPKPVVHAGEAVTRTVDYSGTLILDEQSPDELADLVADEAPVHLYRDPDGRHIYGAVGDVQLTRESHAHWGFGFQLTETEK